MVFDIANNSWKYKYKKYYSKYPVDNIYPIKSKQNRQYTAKVVDNQIFVINDGNNTNPKTNIKFFPKYFIVSLKFLILYPIIYF